MLVASTAGAGHFDPMTPFIRAAVEAGHDVVVAAPEGLGSAVERRGWRHALLPSPDPAAVGPIYASLHTLTHDQANVVMVRDIFAGANAQAALPRLESLIDEFRPDLILREPAEIASYVAAVRAGVEQVQVAIGLRRMDEFVLEHNAVALPERFGVPVDGLRDVRTLSLLPPSLDDADELEFRPREHYRTDDVPVTVELPPGCPPDEDLPLVYVSFGTVAAQVGWYPQLYRTVLDALVDLPVRVLMTIGDADPALLGPLPANTHVEGFWPQDAVLPAAAAVVGHGGFGTTLGGLRAGLPLVVLPLFSIDQHLNADAVAASGVGVVVREPSLDGVRSAVSHVLSSGEVQSAAAGVAAELQALPPASAWLSR
jgi:UDP:flavonoid glycosyltransferase YjiC (YdhE family)